MYKSRAYFVIVFLLWFFSGVNAQTQKSRIRILNALTLEYDDNLGKDVQRLKGSVKFENSGSILDCDSAYFYPNNNIEAFGHIHLNQGDTLHMNSDLLHYNGNEKTTTVIGNVVLTDHDMTLITEKLIFIQDKNLAYYTDGGKIINKDNILTSNKGYYNIATKMLSFKDSVELHNPEYAMFADTLKFNVSSEIAYFSGPTLIISDDSKMYTEKGWYNTKTDYTELTLNNWFESDTQHIRADSLLYDRSLKLGKAYFNVAITDTTNKLLITGEYGQYDQTTNRSFVTEKATMVQTFEVDSLFLHADTLRLYHDTINDLNEVFAFYNVRFFKPDIQGICDSLTYLQKDSIIRMYNDPVLWSEKNQLSGDTVEIELYGGEIKQLNLRKNSFIVSQVDSSEYFNQIKGRNMKAIFIKNELDHIYVNGNGQTLYFAKTDESESSKIIGMNKADCSNILVMIVDNQVSTIKFLDQPTGTLTPLSKIDPALLKLKGYKLRNDEQPKNKNDIYRD
jgi:lipopolysaccharide export system protein LptA